MIDRAAASDVLDSSELRDLAALASQLRRRAGEQPGMRSSDRVGRGYELQGLDPFRTGDDARAIDWRTRLRTGELWVRRHHAEGEAATRILIDSSASMTAAKRRCATRAAAAIAIVAGSAAVPFAIDNLSGTRGFSTRAQLDSAALRPMLDAVVRLARAVPASQLSLTGALDRMRRSIHGDEHVVVISDLADPAPPEELAAAAARLARHVVCIHVVDDRDRALAPDVDELVCAETGTRRRLDDASSFGSRIEAWQVALADAFRRRGVPIVLADAAHPMRVVELANRVVASWS